MRRSRFIFKV